MTMRENRSFMGVAVVCREIRGNCQWFLAKQTEDGGWELPKAQARRGESSVRAAMRNMGERGGLRVKVLEEVGRTSGFKKVGNQKIPQKHLFYFMIAQEASEEPIGFIDMAWFEFRQAIKELESPRDQRMLKKAKEMVKDLKKAGRLLG